MKTTSQFGAGRRAVEIGEIVTLAEGAPLKLSGGAELSAFPMAYQTYGTLNAAKSNAILICHALTGDQYVTGTHPVTEKPGWWSNMVGPGRALDTNKYFIICSNILGGCMGSAGPKEINPECGRIYGLDFPVVTLGDMVNAQALLVEKLGIDKLLAVVGGSMGGMQALEWAVRYPEKMHAVAAIAAAARQPAQNIAFHEIGRQAIMADPDWSDGHYLEQGTYPVKGLSVARMAAHVTYLSEESLQKKFGRSLQDREQFTYGFEADFQIESYLRHQGMTFVERFDANSYLYLTRAASYYDLTEGGKRKLHEVFANSPVRFCIISFTSDWLFPTSESRRLVKALNACGADVSFTEIVSDKGHDAFLLDEPDFTRALKGFITGSMEKCQ